MKEKSIHLEQLKKAVIEAVDDELPRLKEISLRIHANPELGMKEERASKWLCNFLGESGFEVKQGICGLPTAFRATYGENKPRIAVLAEYDALPDIGHACGHNLICTIAAGAAIASKTVIKKLGGSVAVIGTPAEETIGGKIIMAKRGAFTDLDAAFLVHPDNEDKASSFSLALQNLYVEFFGKSAHASASPEQGINALEAMILSFNAIDVLRQHMKSTARVHGIITNGGEAPNIVPAYSSASFMVRAADDGYLEELENKVLDCFRGAAKATGARLKYRWEESRYSSMKSNMVLAGLYTNNMTELGRQVTLPHPDDPTGSTDMGNVSQVVPSIHAMIAIAPKNVSVHSVEFSKAASSEQGLKGMRDGACAVAMTIVDLLANPELLRKASEEFYHN